MDIEVLVSTMFLDNVSLPEQMNIQGNAIIINQTDFNSFPNFSGHYNNVKFYSRDERGLSKSRNLAIIESTSDICVIADDDVKYIDGFREVIKNAYKKYPDADLILFDFFRDDKRLAKKIKSNSGRLNLLQALRGNSVRITFRRKSIVDNGILFNENFGSGSGTFIASEDLVFITDCKNKKLKVYYEQEPILYLKHSKSTWFKGYNDEYFETIGAFSFHLLKDFWFLNAIQFLLRHKRLYKRGDFLKTINKIRKGAIKYKNIIQ